MQLIGKKSANGASTRQPGLRGRLDEGLGRYGGSGLRERVQRSIGALRRLGHDQSSSRARERLLEARDGSGEEWMTLGRSLAVAALALFLLAPPPMARAADLSPLESARIEYLIASIESLPDAQFIRNGTSYDAKTAAAHLRLKLRTAGSRVKSAEDFIRYCASESSISGLPYQIRFADGHLVTSLEYLRGRLAEYDRGR